MISEPKHLAFQANLMVDWLVNKAIYLFIYIFTVDEEVNQSS